MGHPLLINVAELLRRPGTGRNVALDVTPAELELDDPRLDAGAVVEVRLHLESLSDGVVVNGTVDAPWADTCRRCLGPAVGSTASEVHELYQHSITDPEAFELVGDQLDLGTMVREVVMLDLPATAVCRPDCAGLCPVCGVDLNDRSCDCATAATDPRWDALSELLGPSET